MSWSSWFRINSRMVPRLRVGRLLLGGDAAHIHSPAGGQGMNTGIQDMINVCWKLALVIKGQASLALLDTYEQERLPVMREVLMTTDKLTDLVGSENAVVRSLFNHLGPWIGGSEFVQDLGATRMSQIAINYCNSPLSANHAHGGGLHAGDRVPDLRVRFRNADSHDWQQRSLYGLLDPSRFTLLVARAADSSASPAEVFSALAPWRDLFHGFEVAAATEASAHAQFQLEFGHSDNLYLIRPTATSVSPAASRPRRSNSKPIAGDG